ncbi:chloride channel protein [Halpernia sp.]|uniref:chloride channel protein n=1 Tax=Halpernia sp. TaxID=2782209 RepID=UPI003A8F4C35
MKKNDLLHNGIPISPSLNPTLLAEHFEPRKGENKKRILIISALAFALGIAVSFIAKFLMMLVYLLTDISFYGEFSTDHVTPVHNTLGIFVIFVPAIGGLIVGLMVLYGSKAIRGHGIPEAMEQILTNESKIKPTITYLKPLSSAVAIGTGGPFGAEGPIIATGAALGSTLGQILKISDNERKVLLAAGATAGMAAIFGSPIAAIFLAIELLLFEFSARSIIPVAIACITGAAGHHFLFGPNPVFEMAAIAIPSNYALLAYSIMGIIIGVLSVGVSKIVYLVEEGFEKLPIHFMWWPAIGGLAVGIVGYFAPETLGVGYENITNILSGNLALSAVLSLCFLKFISWAIALGSGTSGGTLAPLLTIGGAVGILLGMAIIFLFPDSGISLPLAALVGMAAMFAGSSRALLTSIIFALETTAQSHALLPLLACCLAAYIVSFFIMENTIMTEKIARRGVKTPVSYEPDLLETLTVKKVVNDIGTTINENETIQIVKEKINLKKDSKPNYLVVSDQDGEYKGIVSFLTLFSTNNSPEDKIGTLIKGNYATVNLNDSLLIAAETMAKENADVLPVVENDIVVGIISYHDILSTYKRATESHEMKHPNISLKRSSYKMLIRGQKLVRHTKRRRR